jgi:RNA polymerase sigma-54 factor
VEELSLQHGIPLDDLQPPRTVLTSFDPVGIGAEDLRECLLIQLDRLGKRHSLAYRLVDIISMISRTSATPSWPAS